MAVDWQPKTDGKDEILADDFNLAFESIEKSLVDLQEGKADIINLVDLQDSFEGYKSSTDDFLDILAKNLNDLNDEKASAIDLVDLRDDFNVYKTGTDEELTALDKNKVEKEEGKGLSANDFTNADKEGLDFAVEIASEIHLANTEEGKWLSKNDYTDADKSKVDAIPEPSTLATKKDVIEKASEIKSEVNQNFANALKGKARGALVAMDDISPIEHKMDVVVESENLYVEDLSGVKLSALGKNLFKPALGSTTTNNVTITRNEDKSYILNGTTTEKVYITLGNIPANDDFTYYLSGGVSSEVRLACQMRIDTTNINTVFSVGDVKALDLSQTSNKPYNNFSLIVVIEAGVTLSNVIVKPMISLSSDSIYEPYMAPIEYTVNADGTVEGVTSLYPTTTLVLDTSGVVINAEYSKDINKAFAELQQAIISLGGNV